MAGEQRSPHNTMSHSGPPQSYAAQEFMPPSFLQHNPVSQTLTPEASMSENLVPYHTIAQNIRQDTIPEGLLPYDYNQQSHSQNYMSEGSATFNSIPQEYGPITPAQSNTHGEASYQSSVPRKNAAQSVVSSMKHAEAEEDGIQYTTPKRRTGLRTPKKNNSLKALENVNNLLDRKFLPFDWRP